MGIHRPTDQELYDLLMIGLALKHHNPTSDGAEIKLDYSSDSVFHALAIAWVISVETSTAIKLNWSLVALIKANARIVQGRPSRGDLLAAIKASQERLLVLVPDREFVSAGLVGARGYGLVITEAGLNYADGVRPTYAEHLNTERFAFFWRDSLWPQAMINIARPVEERRRPHPTGEGFRHRSW